MPRSTSHGAFDGAVDALGQPDRGCAALAELAQQAVGPDDGIRAERERHGRRAEFRQAVQEIVGFDGALREQLGERVAKVGVFGREFRQPGHPLGGREVESRVEQRAQSFPFGGGDWHIATDVLAAPIRTSAQHGRQQ
jgi:hypothetical protein